MSGFFCYVFSILLSPLNEHCLYIECKLCNDIGSGTQDMTGCSKRCPHLKDAWSQPGKRAVGQHLEKKWSTETVKNFLVLCCEEQRGESVGTDLQQQG